MSEFEKRTQEVLEESASRLSGRTRSRLTQARHAALAQIEKPARQRWRSFMPAGAAPAVAVLAVVFYTGQPGVKAPLAQGTSAVEDMEILADGDAPDFTEDSEDAEFYEWAAGEMDS